MYKIVSINARDDSVSGVARSVDKLMAKVLVLASLADSLINFRGSLLRALSERGHEVIACAPGENETIKAYLRDLGVRYYSIPLQRTGMNPLIDIRFFVVFYRLLRMVRPELVLTYTIKPVIYGSIVAWIARIPKIYSIITGLGYVFSERELRNRMVSVVAISLYKIAVPLNKKVFFQNPDDIRLFQKKNILRNATAAVLINGSGVNLNHFITSPFPDQISFLLIARLIREKGILEYVNAARIVKQRRPEVEFKLVGHFDKNPTAFNEDELQSWVEEGVIQYLGFLDDVRPAIASSSVYVLPSYREGTPRTVLEAMAMGRPVITTDAPGCRETVVDGENGFLVPVKDSITLSRRMLRFIEDPVLIKHMGAKSRGIAVKKYDVNKVNTVVIDAMELNHHKGA